MILVIAATGYTGRLVATQLGRLGASVRLGGRSLERVEALNRELGGTFECAQVDVTKESSLHDAMVGCEVVINCAGPFTLLGEPVVGAAIRAGAHYLDTTGEQPFIRQVFDKYGAAARESGCALVPACAFEYAIGDAAAAMLDSSGDTQWENIEIRYAFKSIGTSRGTQKSVLRVLGLPAFSLIDEKLSPIDSSKVAPPSSDSKVDEALLNAIESPEFKKLYLDLGKKNGIVFPGGEVLQVPLHMKVRNLTTLITNDLPAPLLAVVGSASTWFGKTTLAHMLDKAIDKGSDGPSEEARQGTSFRVRVTGIRKRRASAVLVDGKDPYLLTAVIISECANQLDLGVSQCSGPTSPAMVAGAEFVQTCTEAFGVRWAKVTSSEIVA